MIRNVVWHTITVAAVALGVILAIQNRGLKRRSADLERELRWASAGLLVPPVETITLEGDSVTLGAPGPGRVQVLLFYTIACEYCAAMTPAWRAVAGEVARSAAVEVYGIQLDSAEAAVGYVAKHRLPYPVIAFTDRAVAHRMWVWYRVGGVPFTVVIDADGQVVQALRGLVGEDIARDSVVAAVRRRLP